MLLNAFETNNKSDISHASISFKNNRFFEFFELFNKPYKRAHDETQPLTPVSSTLFQNCFYTYLYKAKSKYVL